MPFKNGVFTSSSPAPSPVTPEALPKSVTPTPTPRHAPTPPAPPQPQPTPPPPLPRPTHGSSSSHSSSSSVQSVVQDKYVQQQQQQQQQNAAAMQALQQQLLRSKLIAWLHYFLRAVSQLLLKFDNSLSRKKNTFSYKIIQVQTVGVKERQKKLVILKRLPKILIYYIHLYISSF